MKSSMEMYQLAFSSKEVGCYFDADFYFVEDLVVKEKGIIITDENIASCHAGKFKGWKKIVLKAGEKYKQQTTVDFIVNELIKLKADKENYILGVGGGVVTDVAGYAASVYMRGIKFAFVPTSILAMVDAAIGGKNGVDVGVYKNLVGTVQQPEFLLYDYSFLLTLPPEEWVNGFAEIIKHACIKDQEMFSQLENSSLEDFKNATEKIAELVKQNVKIKYNIVSGDELETGERKLLNFGHTLGHAIETSYQLSHGHAVSIGMVAACKISEEINNFPAEETAKVKRLLQKYNLPVELHFDYDKVWDVLLMDKKKSGDTMNFILLNRIGDGVVKPFLLHDLKELIKRIL